MEASSGYIRGGASGIEGVFCNAGPERQRSMTQDVIPGAPKLRADAARNRAKLVATAREVFTEHGGEASLEQIAKAAEVGIGTLYRHFPTRLDLLEAVYPDEVDVLRETAEKVVPNHTPVEALELWLVAFLDYAATKRHIFTELVEAVGRES